MPALMRRLLAMSLALAAAAPLAHAASDCTQTSKGFTPLNDLGVGFYHGFQGGLYPGGGNTRPPAHEAAGLAIAHAIGPLDTLGQPDPAGRVVLISIGMSNCTQEFSTFVPLAMSDPQKAANVKVIDCAQGGQAANLIKDPNAPYWDTVMARLRGQGSSPLQPQAVWIKEADIGPTGGFPAATDTLLWYLGSVVRIIHDKLPNVKLCYLTSRIYAGYATTTLNPEPYAYESGFAVKGLIAAQIAGEDSLNFDPNAGPVEAPWLSWGPYLWADGLTPRSDGLIWRCEDFVTTDGTHPSASGRSKVADSLLVFFKSEDTAVPWFVNATVAVPSREIARRFEAGPSPARGPVDVVFALPAGEPYALEVLEVGGRRVRELARGVAGGGDERRRWNLDDVAGARIRPGVYWVRLTRGGTSETRRVVVLAPR